MRWLFHQLVTDENVGSDIGWWVYERSEGQWRIARENYRRRTLGASFVDGSGSHRRSEGYRGNRDGHAVTGSIVRLDVDKTARNLAQIPSSLLFLLFNGDVRWWWKNLPIRTLVKWQRFLYD